MSFISGGSPQRRFARWAAYPVLLTTLSCASLQGQERRSALSGVVRDPSGAAVEAASVRVENLATGETREAPSSASGAFRFGYLEPGEYKAAAAMPGFRTALRPRVTVEIGQETIVDFQLEVGEVSETVEVTAEAHSVGLSASTLSSVMDGRTVQDLPLDGRDFAQLATLDAGVPMARARGRNENNGFGLQLSFAGSRPYQNNFLVDGVSVSTYNNSTPGSINGINLGVDAIAEFAVMTSGFGAQYGRSAGGVLHAVTRSGSNEFHGGLSYLHRNDNLDARNFFDGEQIPEFRRHQFSAFLGGPLQQGKHFFFVNYEGLREARGRTQIDTTPSAAARQGSLSTGQVAVDPVMSSVLALYPLPNGEVFGDTGLFIFENSEAGGEDFVTGRADSNLGERDKLFLRWTFSGGARQDETAFAVNERRNRSRMQSGAIEETHVFSGGSVNTARLGLLRTVTVTGETRAQNPAADSPELAFVPGAAGAGLIAVPGLSIFPGGTGGIDRDAHAFTSYQASDDFSWNWGRHQLRSGARAERTHFNTDSQSRVSGEYRFPTVAHLVTNRPDLFRGMFPGADTIRGHRQWILSGYLQDSWNPHPRLTLDLGLRYEWASVPDEVNGKIANLDSLMSPAMRVGGPLFDNPAGKNFAPRAGFAWRAARDGSTVLRAGYGIYHDLILTHFLILAGVRNPPFFGRGDVRQLEQGAFPRGGYEELGSRGDPDTRVERIPRNLQQPYVQQWNLSVQQAMPGGSSLRLSYAGSRGLNLSAVTEDANLSIPQMLPGGRRFYPADGVKPNPHFGIIRDRTFDASSSYHGFQAQLRKRYSRGLHGQLGYTFSKSIDDSSGFLSPTEWTNQIGLPMTGDPRFNRGLSSHDVRHVLSGAGLWEMPSPRAGLARAFLGNWTAGAIVTAAAGQPQSVRLAYDAARTRTGRPDADSGQRPDLAPGAGSNPVTGNVVQWVDPAYFSRPVPGFLGDLGRNTIVGPGLFTIDSSLGKRMQLKGWGEQTTLEFRAEFFNLLNRANFELPNAGRMELFTQTGVREDFARITNARDSREIQFSLRLRF